MSTAVVSSHPRTILFARGTIARLQLWPTLRLAVHENWGGPDSAEKQRWLAGVIVDQFEEYLVASTDSSQNTPSSSAGRTGAEVTTPPNEYYIEELLLQIMADEFDVSLEDDSTIAVARDVVKLFKDICAGNESTVIELEAQAERVKGKLPQYEVGIGSESESGSDWEDDEGEEEEENGENREGEQVPQLLDHSESRKREEPEVDEDGFTMVKKKGRR